MIDDKLIELSTRYGVEVAHNLLAYSFVKEKVQKIPYSFAKQHLLLPLEERGGKVLLAVADLLNFEAIEEVRCQLGKEVIEILALPEALEKAIELCYRQKESATSDLIASLQKVVKKQSADEEDGYDLLEQTTDSPVIQILNSVLSEAIQQGASDIHFEPMEDGLSVRYRIDGVLQMRHAPSSEFQSQLLTRIKVMAKLDIAEHRLPQDGRIKLEFGGRQIDFRVSTVPVVYGERVVLRILDKTNILYGLNQIGMASSMLEIFKKLIQLSEGIILVTGPTGSGKTTTLYAALSDINSTETNIMTIEDPVEYKLQGMAQIGVNPKIDLDFAKGLRHILRQDPDVIMIGEIRDKETADIAIQASLTGHLVLSTLHTNDAPSALTRLVDMGIEPYLLSSSVVGVLAQRLVRTICPHCKTSYAPSDAELKEIGLLREDLDQGQLFKGTGCAHCYESGYKGRHAIYELMVVSSHVKRQLLNSADSVELQRTALAEGMRNLRQDGAELVRRGLTSTAEVLRAARAWEGV